MSLFFFTFFPYLKCLQNFILFFLSEFEFWPAYLQGFGQHICQVLASIFVRFWPAYLLVFGQHICQVLELAKYPTSANCKLPRYITNYRANSIKFIIIIIIIGLDNHREKEHIFCILLTSVVTYIQVDLLI